MHTHTVPSSKAGCLCVLHSGSHLSPTRVRGGREAAWRGEQEQWKKGCRVRAGWRGCFIGLLRRQQFQWNWESEQEVRLPALVLISAAIVSSADAWNMSALEWPAWRSQGLISFTVGANQCLNVLESHTGPPCTLTPVMSKKLRNMQMKTQWKRYR